MLAIWATVKESSISGNVLLTVQKTNFTNGPESMGINMVYIFYSMRKRHFSEVD